MLLDQAQVGRVISMLAAKDEQGRIKWAGQKYGTMAVLTGFEPHAAVILHMCAQASPGIPVLNPIVSWPDGKMMQYLEDNRLPGGTVRSRTASSDARQACALRA